MAIIKNMKKVTSLEVSTSATPSPLILLIVSVLILCFASSANALGEFCRLFRAECRGDCAVSSIVKVNIELCERPLECCFNSQGTQSDGNSINPAWSRGRLPYNRRRQTLPPFRPPTTTPSPSFASTDDVDNYVIPPPNVCGVVGHSRVRRIVNGVRAERCQYPWMVLLVRGSNPWDTCGASLISDRHIITAAHCFGFIQGRPVIIVGEYDKNEIRPASEIRITKFNITIHPHFDNVQYVNDIAMITLDTPLNLSQFECLRPICLPGENEELPVGTDCRVVGWGSVQRRNVLGFAPQTSNVLQETTIKVVRPGLCDRKWGKKYHQDVQICAGDMSGQTDSCLGDSGGPLMCPSRTDKNVYYLHGVVSLGNIRCAEPNVPALYSKVGKYRAWIENMRK